MYVSLLFWLALVLPGYVVVRHVFADDLESGLFGVVGLSYLFTFGVLSPISIACYVLHAPLVVFSAACVLSVLASLLELTRRGWWRETGRLILGAITFELAIVVADSVLGARIGALVGGDAVTHLARIRTLLDHGFNNSDPFVGGHFFPIYHTNLVHAMYAACSQLTGVHHVWVWFASLPWGKLLVASGCYYMAWSVFDRRWVGWVAAIFTVGVHAPMNFLVYPNKLAPLWILPLMLGFAVRACRAPCTWKSPIKLAAGSLVVGQVHGLYGAFAGITLGPVLAVTAIVHIFLKHPGRWCLAMCTVALTAALPFLLISRATAYPKPGSSPKVNAGAKVESDVSADSANVESPASTNRIGDRRVSVGPKYGWGWPRDRRSSVASISLALGIVCALVGRRRRQAAVLLAIAGTAAMIFYVPSLYSVAVDLFGKKWIVSRMGMVLYLGYVGLVPSSVAFLVEPFTQTGWLRWILGLPVRLLRVALVEHKGRRPSPPYPGLTSAWRFEGAMYRAIISVLVLLAGMTFAPRKGPYTWEQYWSKTVAPRAQRHDYLDKTTRVMTFCKKNIPTGVTVLLEEWPGMVLTVVHDCYIVAPASGSLGVPDLNERRADLKLMLAPETRWETRRKLLRKYDVKHFFPASAPTDWTRGHTMPRIAEPGFQFFILDTE